MRNIRHGVVILGLLLCLRPPAAAEVSIGIGLPHVSIGINLPIYPVLAPVPGYPVYYAPGIEANYFFYDGYYWVYQDDYWYASSWYNGPWWMVEPDFVPLFILRIPVVYYRRPPPYFFGWHAYEPPRWGQHWGHDWERRHSGWKHWHRDRTPALAPRPDYQRRYSGDRYPRGEEQRNLHQRHYRYQPRDTQVREYVQPRIERKAPSPDQRGRRDEPAMRSPGAQEGPRSTPPRQDGWSGPRPQPAPPPQQGQRRSPRDDERQPGLRAPDREQEREHQEYKPREPERKTPEVRDYRRYGRSGWQGEKKERERGRSEDRDRGGERDRGRGRD
ncbi:MAG: hypothetical protein A2091_04025 [Desulfuromonadales bacterium GWD2_61_12]|nr:MAG: hypothetical protein A2091_04025 [Desulfuromonadales bacterium GWD2_61_12]